MSVTLLQVLAAAQSRQASLVGEMAGYLVLGVADQIVGGPRAVEAKTVILEAGGTVRVVANQPAEAAECEGQLRQLLHNLLGFSRTVGPALVRCGTRAPRGRIEDLVRELEAALIPVNRAAGKRALARLYRETLRAADVGGLSEPSPLSPRLEPDPPPRHEESARGSVADPEPLGEVLLVASSEPAVRPVPSESALVLGGDEATDPVPAAWESSAFWLEPCVQEHTLPLPSSGAQQSPVDDDPEIEIEIVVEDFIEVEPVEATPVFSAPPVERTEALAPVTPRSAEHSHVDVTPVMGPVALPERSLVDRIETTPRVRCDTQTREEVREANEALFAPADVPRAELTAVASAAADRVDAECFGAMEPEWVAAVAFESFAEEPLVEAQVVAAESPEPEVEAEPIAEALAPVPLVQGPAVEAAVVEPEADPSGAALDLDLRREPAPRLEEPEWIDAELIDESAAVIANREAVVEPGSDAAPAAAEWIPVSPPVETRTPAPAVDPWQEDPVAMSESRPSTPKAPEHATGRFASAPPVFAPRCSDVDDLLRQFASGQSDDEICSSLAYIADEFSPASPPVRAGSRRRRADSGDVSVPLARVAGVSKR